MCYIIIYNKWISSCWLCVRRRLKGFLVHLLYLIYSHIIRGCLTAHYLRFTLSRFGTITRKEKNTTQHFHIQIYKSKCRSCLFRVSRDLCVSSCVCFYYYRDFCFCIYLNEECVYVLCNNL